MDTAKPAPHWHAIHRQMGRLLLICALLLTTLPQALYAQAADGPTLWLKFDEAAGATTFADASGNNTNGSCAGDSCPTAGATGRVGQAVQFDGTNDRIQVALNAPAGNFTLATWVRNNNAQWGDWRTIFEFGDDQPWFGVTPSGRLTLYPVIFGGTVPLNEWAHVAYTWNGTEGRLYVNGQSVNANNQAPPVGGQGLRIGIENNDRSAWPGLLDDARVYARALSAAEIDQLSKPGTGPVVQPTEPPNPPADNARLIDLTVSVERPVPTATDRKPYEDLFQLFADSIYEMSNGTQRIRTITIYDNGRFADRADIRWIRFEGQPRASTNSYGKRGQVYMGDAIFDAQTVITDPNTIGTFLRTLAHEWGHYFYGVLDEYEGRRAATGPGSPQPGDTPPQPCSVMCAAGPTITWDTLNFSTRNSTVNANRTNTAHYRVFQASAWETVARNPTQDPASQRGQRLHWPELAAVAPAANANATVELPANQAAARSSLQIVWADGNAAVLKHRFIMIDVSATMAADNKLGAAKVAIKNYIDRSNVGDRLGIITFADTHTVVQPLTTIDNDTTKAALKAAVDGIQVKAGVNDRRVDAANQAAITALQQAANNAAIVDRGVYILIDGGYTDQTEPFIFQKVDNDYNNAGLQLGIFNFANATKPNDLYSNSLELLRPSRGTYRYVGGGAFTLPPLRSAEAQDPHADDAEVDDLVDALTDVDQEYSPVLDVDLGTFYAEIGASEAFTSLIYVDETLDEVEVELFFSGAPEDAQVTLYDPDGSATEPAFCDTDGFDTLCYFVAFEPLTGTWELEVFANELDLFVEYAAIGYALDGFTYEAFVESRSGSNFVTYPDDVVLVAGVREVELIAKAGLTAWAEDPSGEFIDLMLKDDGVAPDETADDGLYTGFLPYNQAGDYYVTIVFDNIDGEAFFTQAGLADVVEVQTRPVPIDFDRFATVDILIDDYAGDDHGDNSEKATDLPANNSDVHGRIDRAGDEDNFQITSPEAVTGDPKSADLIAAQADAPQTYILRMTNLGFGMNANVTVTTSAGTNTYQTGPLGYNDYWTTPVTLNPGETAQVTVTHSDGSAATGSYAISFGDPLPNESTGTSEQVQLFLPIISR